MPTPTSAWNEQSPAGSDNASEGDDAITLFKKQVRERMNNGSHDWEDGSGGASGPAATAGVHACGIEDTNEFNIYKTDKTTKAVEVDDSAETLTLGTGTGDTWAVVANTGTFDSVSAATLSATGVLTGDRQSSLVIPIPGNAAGRVKGIMFYNNDATDIVLEKVQAFAFDAPSGGTCVIDVHKLATFGDTVTDDPNAAGLTILSAPLTIADGEYTALEVTPSTTTLSQYEALVIDIDSNAGAADNLVVHIKIKRTK